MGGAGHAAGLVRHVNWPSRLAAFIEARRHQPFVWGRHDCCLFACDWVVEATGWDPAADFRGRYDSRAGALRALRDIGGGTLADTTAAIAARVAALPYEHPLKAQRGDLALVDMACGPSLAVVAGGHLVGAGPAGLLDLPLTDARRAWPV